MSENSARQSYPVKEASLQLARELFLPDNGLTEVRCLKVPKKGTISGYFDKESAFLGAARQLSGQGIGVYVTLNEPAPVLLLRRRNRLEPYVHDTCTKDEEIVRRRWLLVDCDPVRPTGISSSREEIEMSVLRARDIREFLRGHQFPEPVLASSGNGVHLLYPFAVPNSEAVLRANEDLLRYLEARFGDEQVSIDRSTFNAGRLVRLYGTLVKKGDDSPERPHRIAAFLEELPASVDAYLQAEREARLAAADVGKQDFQVPEFFGEHRISLTLENLNLFLRWAKQHDAAHAVGVSDRTVHPAAPAARQAVDPKPPVRRYSFATLDVVAWFKAHRLYGREGQAPGQHLVGCPWGDGHSTPDQTDDSDTVVWVPTEDRPAAFKCFHDSCTGRTLHDLAAHWEDAELYGARLRDGAYPLTDTGNAERLVDTYGQHVRHSNETRQWYHYKDGRWCSQDLGSDKHVRQLAVLVARQVQEEGRNLLEKAEGDDAATKRARLVAAWGKSSESWQGINNTVRVAADVQELGIQMHQFDASPYLLNCANGTVDLRTGKLLAHRAADYCTLQVPHAYDEEATCPLFEQFLREVFAQDEAVIAYVLRILGYAVLGTCDEQALYICVGDGANGKTTLFETVRRVLGTYADVGAPNLLVETKSERHPTEVADLRGKRLVICSESDSGAHLAEGLVKRLTGKEQLRARPMRGNFFAFNPTHTLFYCVNHLPRIRGIDEAIWRRIPVIRFGVTFRDRTDPKWKEGDPVKDPQMQEHLIAEAPGILRLLVKEAGAWLAEPKIEMPVPIQKEMMVYREDQDLVGAFIAQQCAADPGASCSSSELLQCYLAWALEEGHPSLGQRTFTDLVAKHGYTRQRQSSGVRWFGLRIKTEAELKFAE